MALWWLPEWGYWKSIHLTKTNIQKINWVQILFIVWNLNLCSIWLLLVFHILVKCYACKIFFCLNCDWKNWITALISRWTMPFARIFVHNPPFFFYQTQYSLATEPPEAVWGKNGDTLFKFFWFFSCFLFFRLWNF